MCTLMHIPRYIFPTILQYCLLYSRSSRWATTVMLACGPGVMLQGFQQSCGNVGIWQGLSCEWLWKPVLIVFVLIDLVPSCYLCFNCVPTQSKISSNFAPFPFPCRTYRTDVVISVICVHGAHTAHTSQGFHKMPLKQGWQLHHSVASQTARRRPQQPGASDDRCYATFSSANLPAKQQTNIDARIMIQDQFGLLDFYNMFVKKM